MNIQVEKLELIEWIAKLNDISVIEKLMEIHEEFSKTAISVDEKASIERGLKDFDEGRIHSHETVKKFYGKYL